MLKTRLKMAWLGRPGIGGYDDFWSKQFFITAEALARMHMKVYVFLLSPYRLSKSVTTLPLGT